MFHELQLAVFFRFDPNLVGASIASRRTTAIPRICKKTKQEVSFIYVVRMIHSEALCGLRARLTMFRPTI